MHGAVAGYHRMFFERNLALDVLSSRELGRAELQKCKLILLPYPLMMTGDEAAALGDYVRMGGNLFVEARPGWVDEAGHAEAMVPGFGWAEMFGVREASIEPGKEFPVKWDGEEFSGVSFQEHFVLLDDKVRVVARFADGSAAAYEHAYGKGSAILLGTFAGQFNQQKPVAIYPLGEILAKWAGLQTPELKAPAPVELRELEAANGKFVFFFNYGEKPAEVEFTENLAHPAARVREIVEDKTLVTSGRRFQVRTAVPGQAVRIYRIHYQAL